MDGPFYEDLLPPFPNANEASAITLTTSLQVMCQLGRLPKFAPNYFGWVGKAVRITMFGQCTSVATPGAFNWGIYWGAGTAGLGTLVNGVNVTWTANQANSTFLYKSVIRCRSTGASGSLLGTGWLFINGTGLIPCPFQTPSATTVDLTQNYYLFPQLSRSGSTAETCQLHDAFVEALN